jgi:methylthioribose-1-phosphate isomerase
MQSDEETGMKWRAVEWIGDLSGTLRLIDQTLLPERLVTIDCRTPKEVFEAIQRLSVRGAPAIGVAGAMGTVLGVRDLDTDNREVFLKELRRVGDYLASARPTAVNLGWAIRRLIRLAESHTERPVGELKELLFEEAQRIRTEDAAMCRAIGENGARYFRDGEGVLTHCNAGALATAEYGTALATIFVAHEQGKRLHVYADETRPLLQGARLTAWELMQAGVDVTLICDNVAATVMRQGRIQRVVVGADRIAANGDTANKIGTYGVAILAKEHGIPFYVAAPSSTFDLSITDGTAIPIEERAAEEVTNGFGRRTAPVNVKVYNPAFDVTPAPLIAAIITERGVIEKPDAEKIKRHFEGKNDGKTA